MKKIVTVCAITLLLISSGCVHKKKVRVSGVDKGSLLNVAKQPIYSLNLLKKEIPEHLKELKVIYQAPNSCDEYQEELALLNTILGDDYVDKKNPNKDVITLHLGQMLGDEVASNIPFNSIIKSLSGAKKHEKARLSAFVKGETRRSYLTGWADGADCLLESGSEPHGVQQNEQAR